MTTVTIRGIPVKFPFTPYEIQTKYMEKVIDCLENGKNGILESPTGTGKTLSLLCASLAWLEFRKSQAKELIKSGFDEFYDESFDNEDEDMMGTPASLKIPKIIYASRTHTQLLQAMQEMKRTAYNNMKACCLGSREQMCIDEEVIQERSASLKVNICRTKVKRRQCKYYSRVEKERNNPVITDLNIVDIEDVVELGRCHHFCPYYMAREIKTMADVIFMPYNYLLDPRTSKNMDVEIGDNVIILDEAHNIEKICEDAVSVQIKSSDIASAIEDVTEVVDLITDHKRLDVEEVCFTPNKLRTLNEMLTSFASEMDGIRLVKLAEEGTVFDGDFIFEILEKSGITEKNNVGITNLINDVLEFLATTRLIQKSGYGLQIFNSLLFIVFFKIGPEFRQKIKERFKVQIEDDFNERFRRGRFSQSVRDCSRLLNFWCFSPGFAMNILQDRQIHCLILTSGTLAPLKPLISELELDVDVQIENPHIVRGDQVCVKILSKGPDNQLLNSNYQNRSNPKYLQSLGLVISNLIRVIPDGVLIFFPSYTIMDKTVERWQQCGIWDAINHTKPVYIEPKDKISFTTAMTEYYAKIKDPSYGGAIFMGVCRGKVSEGLDFADINGRAVFITGLPYPPLKDPKIILKKRYLDFRNSKDKEFLKGEDWYGLEATRAINQAIGRVIRHKNDYGAIILLDSRFTQPRIKSNLSLWLRHHITDMKNFGEITRTLNFFFENARKAQPEVEREVVIQELVNVQASTSGKEPLVKIHSRKYEEDLDESPSKKPVK